MYPQHTLTIQKEKWKEKEEWWIIISSWEKKKNDGKKIPISYLHDQVETQAEADLVYSQFVPHDFFISY